MLVLGGHFVSVCVPIEYDKLNKHGVNKKLFNKFPKFVLPQNRVLDQTRSI